MKSLRTFFRGLPGGHRPPTGPLTTAEATEAEDLRRQGAADDEQRLAHEDEASPEPPSAPGD